jgi:hypothetical protein
MLTFTHTPPPSEEEEEHDGIGARWTATVALHIVAGDAVRLSLDVSPATVTDGVTPFGAALLFAPSLFNSNRCYDSTGAEHPDCS